MLLNLSSFVCRKIQLLFSATILVSAFVPHLIHSSVQAQAEEKCAIIIGADGASETYTSNTYGTTEFPSVMASNFIRQTSGPCIFTLYNDPNFEGRHVNLGTDLNTRIRAGLDGVEKKDHGGGDTWRIRSLRITWLTDLSCKLRIGGNGVRMTYYNGYFDPNKGDGAFSFVPAMNRLESLSGPCNITIYVNPNFTGNPNGFDPQVKTLYPPLKWNYDPGFRVRSFEFGL